MDIKEWIDNKAEEIALYIYDLEIYDLPKETRTEIYNQAVELWGQFLTDMINRAVKKSVLDLTGNPPHYECIRCGEYIYHDKNCPCNSVLNS